ncbi:hypothetical protein AC1031_020555 [Aphanomyces cochlioides]|nr:hypothetical protein AC1031_020555 [Aphanomyces cochlioides]
MRRLALLSVLVTAVVAQQSTCNTTVESYINAVNQSTECKINDPKKFCATPSCTAITAAGKLIVSQECGKDPAYTAQIKYSFPNMCDSTQCQTLVSQFASYVADCTNNPRANPNVLPSYATCAPCRSLTDASFNASLGTTCGYNVDSFAVVLSEQSLDLSISICKGVSPDKSSTTSSGSSSTVFVIVGIAAAILIILGAVIYKLKLKNDIAKRNFDYINETQGNGELTLGGGIGGGDKFNDVGRIANDIRFDEELAQFRIPQNEIQNVSLLVKGGYGVVFHASFGKDEVAMKQLLPSKSKDFDAIQEFMNEIRLCARLEHPKIVKFIGISWSTLHDLAVLSEFMPRGDVSTLLKKDLKKSESHRILHWDSGNGTTTTTKALIAADIADALVYLHSFQPTIIHRDLKSKNVLLSESWEAKLSDFGISRVTSLEDTMTSNIGTVAWIAPEVLSGGRYTEKADIYSFGVLLSELDTNEVPYANLMNKSKDASFSNARIALMVSEGSLKPDFTDRIPEELLAVALECLAFNENDRPTAMALSYKIHTIAKNL